MSTTLSIDDMLDRDEPTIYARVKSERGLRPMLTIQLGGALVMIPYRAEHGGALAAVLRQAAREVETVTEGRVPA